MARRPLPTDAEARAILARKRTRPTFRPAPPVGKSLGSLIKVLDDRYGQGVGALEARWPEILADEPLARVTQPIKLVKGRAGASSTLEIRVAGAAAGLVQHRSEEILARVNLFLGSGEVGKLRISQGPVKAAPRRKPKAAAPRNQPLDAAAEEALGASVENAPTPDLRDALTRLGRAVLREEG